MSEPKKKRRRAGVALRLGDTDKLYVTMHQGYLHLKLISPGRRFFTQEIYIPRKKLVPLVRWILKSTREVPENSADTGFYVPDATREYLAAEALFEAGMKQAKRKRDRRRRART